MSIDIKARTFIVMEKAFARETDQQSLSSLVLAALSKINEAIESKNPDAILTSLGSPSAKLTNVRPKNAELYAIILKQAKEEKAKVFSVLPYFETQFE